MEVKIGAAKFSGKELQLAGQLIDTLTAKFDPAKFHDEYEANLKRLIAHRQKGEKVTLPKRAKQAPVVNIMDALRKSLAERRAAPKPRQKSAA